MMKLKKLLFALLLAVSTTALADNYAYLTIDQSGEETSFSLSEITKITFDNTNMIVNLADGNTRQIPLLSLSKMFFSETGTMGITSATNGAAKVRLVDGVIYVNARVGSSVNLYDMGGKVVRTVVATGNDTQINVSGLAKGVYIVKVGDEAKKLMNK